MDEATRAVATAFAVERYPAADLVVVGGSAAEERRPRSDIDLLVVGPAGMFAAGVDEAAYTERWRSELFEVFASTPAAFQRHQRAGATRFRPVSAFLLLDGVPVVDRGTSVDLVAWTRELVERGPAVPPAELAYRRYSVTTTLDDLLDTTEPGEAAVLAGQLFERLAEFLLLAEGHWIASGRHLLRRLRALDVELAAALGGALAARDVPALEHLTSVALAPYGGRLMEGYVR